MKLKITLTVVAVLLISLIVNRSVGEGLEENLGDLVSSAQIIIEEEPEEEEAEEVFEEAEEAEEIEEEPEEEEPKIEVLENLDDVEAGEILSSEQLDYEHLDHYFTAYEISDELFERIYGDDKSYKTYCTVPRSDLRYIKLLHIGFDSKIHVGELMVNTLLADEIIEIFEILFENQYQIEKMYLVDNYNADEDASIADNNTSAFNFRTVTDNPNVISYHGFGCAIDINPINNPYVWYENGVLTWEDPDADLYLDRNAEDAYERHMLNYDDLCYQLFHERGWTWGGDWANPIDYQHFEKVVATY